MMAFLQHRSKRRRDINNRRSHPNRRSKRVLVTLFLDLLEDRTVPSILFSNSGSLTTSDAGGPVLTNVEVEVVFWGTGWSSHDALKSSMSSAVDSILAGPYFSALSQYRSSIGNGIHLGNVTITSSDPPPVMSNSDVVAMLRTNINNDSLPSPNSNSQLLYMVIPQPGTRSGNLSGEHSYDYSTKGKFHYGWTIDDGNLDIVTPIFSHELVESVTDPEGNAIQENPRDSHNWNEIGDNEAENYSYRLNNVLVQSYFSQRDHAYIVPMGQRQDFSVSASRVLTVSGDQLSNPDDTIALDRSASDGVIATLNGETVQFDANALTGIVVADGLGTDTINVEKTVAAAPVTLNLGKGTVLVNLSPGARNLSNLLGAVTINGSTGLNTLTVNDQANGANSAYTLTGSTFARTGAGVINYGSLLGDVVLNGGNGSNTYAVTNTQSTYATTLNTGPGTDTVSIQATTGPLTVVSTGGNAQDVVNLGSNGSVQNIRGAVAIENPPDLSSVVVDDWADAQRRSLTLSNYTPPRDTSFGQIADLAPAPIKYEYDDTRTVTIKTGAGGVNASVSNTGVPTVALVGNANAVNTLVGSDSDNTWTITDANAGTLTGSVIVGRISFSDFQNLAGGAGNNTFALQNGGSVAGWINGGGGTNTLDYSNYSGNVVVDLQTGTATGVRGGIANIKNINGGNGPGYNILVGNGANVLSGGSNASNLLIAGSAASTLLGGNGEDILIGGTTAYDTDLASLRAIMGEWLRADESYNTRVFNITNGFGVPLLDASTVRGNGGGNTLMGGAGLDLYYGNLALDVYDWNPMNEYFISV
jgi:hypothetical protein